MSDCDVTQMEELMAREPQPITCLDCGWKGDEAQLNKNNNCPKCNSYAIEYDIPESAGG
jgi:predicted Zn-ribbon and HTH transcriptional regulator